MKKRTLISSPPPICLLAEWRLPRSGGSIRLEIIRDTDGLDSPRLNYTADMKPGDPVELPPSDDRYIERIIEPMVDTLVSEYFKKRLRHKKIGYASPGKPGKVRLTEARSLIQIDLERIRQRRVRDKQLRDASGNPKEE